MNNNRLYKGIICASLTALIAVSTCAPVYAANTETTSAADNVGMPNPFQECANMEEAEQIAGFGFYLPPLSDYTITVMNYKGNTGIFVYVGSDENHQTIYSKYDKATYENKLENGLSSGYKAVNDARLDKLGLTAYVNTKNGECYDIMWTVGSGSYGYSIDSTDSMTEEAMIIQALNVAKYNAFGGKTTMPNPFQECANMEEAHQITGFGFSVPPFGNYTISALNYEGIKEIVVRVPNSDNHETVYTNYDKASYEKLLDMALKSGDYKAVSNDHLNKLGITAYVNTKNDNCYDIMWSKKDGNYGYSIYFSEGIEENAMIWQALKITAYNNVINGYYGDKSLFKAKIEPIPAQVWTGNDLFLKESDVTVTYQGENLESGLDYYVRTFDDNRIGLAKAMIVPTEKSDFVGFNFKTFAVVPQAVTNVKYTDHTSTSVTIRFNTTEGAERYAVFTADSIGAQVADVGAERGTATQSVTIGNLEPNKTYKLIVKPYFEEDGEAWYGPDSEVITTKTDTEALAIPAPVNNLTLANATKTSAQISFSKSEEADGYTVFGFKTGKKYADVSTKKGASTLKKTINGLQPGKTYRFTVRPYKKIDGKIYYGDTSKTIVIKTAK